MILNIGQEESTIEPQEASDPNEDTFHDMTTIQHAQQQGKLGRIVFQYKEDGTLPENSKLALRVTVESQNYIVVDGVLHYVLGKGSG